MTNDHRGAKIGERVALLVSRAIVATHKALIGTKHKLAMMIFHAISDEISQETHYVLGPTLEDLLASDKLHPNIRPHIEFLAHTEGQLSAIAGTALSSSGILSSLAIIMNNLLTPGVHETVAKNPYQVPDPGTLAEIAARGIAEGGDIDYGFAGQGFDQNWENRLIEAARAYPGAADALAMLRRGYITSQQAQIAMQRNGIPQQFINAYLSEKNIPLSPADAALAYLRDNMTEGEAVKTAESWGVSKSDFDVLVGNTGEPLGLMQLLEAYRRNFIDQATLRKGILQSRIRNEWIPVAEKLRYSPMSVADAVNGVVQNHLDTKTAAEYAQQNGLEPSAFPILVETAGQPLSRTEMESLYNRGIVTEAEVEQALRESRLKDKYVSQAFKLHVRLLEPRMLASAVEYGSTTHANAIRIAMDYGFSPTDAQILVNQGSNAKLRTYRQSVMTSLEALYEDNLISLDTAHTLGKGLGFEASEVNFIFEAAEFKRQAKMVSSAVTAIKTKYIGRHVTKNEAIGLIDALGVPPSQRDEIVKIWDIEHTAATKVLTTAQVVKAVKDSLITSADGLSRLMYDGYTQEDATLLLEGA